MAALTEHGKAYNGYAFMLWTDKETGTTHAVFDPVTGVATFSDKTVAGNEYGLVLVEAGREEEDYVRNLLRAAGHTIIGLR